MIFIVSIFAFVIFSFFVGLSFFIQGKPVPRSCGGFGQGKCEFCGGEGECKKEVG